MLYVGIVIPIESIDMFWKKLDISPAYKEETTIIDINRELELMKQHIIVEPEHIQKNMFEDIWGSILPWKTKKKEPVVKTNNRGRPKKDKQKAMDPPRYSSFENTDRVSTVIPGRHSVHIDSGRHSVHAPIDHERHDSFLCPSSISQQYDFLGFTQNSCVGPPKPVKQSTYAPGDEERFNFMRFAAYIPRVFHPYISSTVDVRGDGNCGFRAVAVGLGLPETQWQFIRNELYQELTARRGTYEDMFGLFYNNLEESLLYNELSFAPQNKWMIIPETGVLIANRFEVAVIIITQEGPVTYFPMWVPPPVHEHHRFVILGYVYDNHFIHVKMSGEYPIPPTGNYFKRSNVDGKRWDALYKHRIQEYMYNSNYRLPMDYVPDEACNILSLGSNSRV